MFCVYTLNVHDFTAGALPGLPLLQTAHVAAPLGAQYSKASVGRLPVVVLQGAAT
jgi:hypothetical protein